MNGIISIQDGLKALRGELEDRERQRAENPEDLEDLGGTEDAEYKKWVLANVPKIYQEAKLKDFQGEMGTIARSLYRGTSGIVKGANGVGKTRMAWAICKTWKYNGESYIYEKAFPLLSRLKKVIAQGGDHVYYIEDRYGKKCPHLIIDEVDKIRGSEADFVYLTYLIDYRYEWGLHTVVLGNDTKDLEAILGQSTYSRLTGDGAQAFELSGQDWRRRSDDAQ